jgi:hypothetical protein
MLTLLVVICDVIVMMALGYLINCKWKLHQNAVMFFSVLTSLIVWIVSKNETVSAVMVLGGIISTLAGVFVGVRLENYFRNRGTSADRAKN